MTQPELYQSRLARLTQVLQDSRLDAIALNPGASLVYLTGLHFHLSERPVIGLFIAGKIPIFILPELEARKLDHLPFKHRAFFYGENPDDWGKTFEEAARVTQLNGRRVGVEHRQMRILELRLLEKAAPQTFFLNGGNEMAALRMYKDAQEIQAMRAGAKIAENALQATLPLVKVGMTEKELANELTVQLLRHGSDPKFPFSPIVQSGPNSANPHGGPTDRALAEGDLLLIDWGATADDYYSDITRTFAIGDVADELAHIAEVVRQANAAARAAARPGVEASAVDRAARSVIIRADYAEYFTHRTGHGLGLEGHEAPYIRADNPLPLKPGMAFTIEPGIYIPNKGGVRIEDDVVIAENGLDCLTTLPRELIRLG